MSKVKNVIILTMFTILSGGINYLVYPFLMRYLSLEDFASYSVVLSVMSIINIPGIAFGYMALMYFRNHDFSASSLGFIERKGWLYSLLLSIFVGGILLFLYPSLGVHSYTILALTMVFGLIVLPNNFYPSFLQAREKFLLLGSLSLVLAILKLLFTLSVLFSAKLSYAVAALSFSALLITGAYVYFSHKAALDGVTSIKKQEKVSLPFISFIIVTSVIVIFQNVDIILVKFFFSSTSVAAYASMSVIAKFSLFIITALETVYAPGLLDKSKIKEHRNIFLNLSKWMVFGFILSIFLAISGRWIILLIRPELHITLLSFIALALASVALGFFTLFSKVSIAWGMQPYYYILGGILAFLLLVSSNNNIEHFTYIYCLSALFLLGMSYISIYLKTKSIQYT